jgi:hypothetical protein
MPRCPGGLTECLDERVLSSLSVFELYFLHCLCGVLVAGGIFIYIGPVIIVLAKRTAGTRCRPKTRRMPTKPPRNSPTGISRTAFWSTQPPTT